jgi:hypothetical protein
MPVTRAWHGDTDDWDHRLERASRLLKLTATALVGAGAIWSAAVDLW